VAQCRTVRKHCYHVPVPTRPILNRCIPAYEFNYTKTKSCLFPTQINDATDPDCLVIKSTVTTESEEPSTPVLVFDQLNQLYFSTGRYITDIARSWWVIALSAIAVPALLSALWLAAMKRFTKAVIVVAILTLLVAGILLTLFIFAQAGTIQYDWIAQYNLEKYAFLSNESTLILAYVMTAVLIVMLLVLFALRKSIARSIHVLKLGSKALRKLPMALVFPLTVVALVLLLFVWFAYVAASLASAGEVVVVDVRQELDMLRQQANTTISQRVLDSLINATNEWDGSLTYYAGNTALNWLQIYNAFMFLWSAAFVHGFSIMVTASAVGMWYFSKNKSKQADLKVHKLPKYYILDSVARTLLFHTGTIAVGSLLIAIVSTIRWFVQWLQAQLMRQYSQHESTYIPVNIRLAIDCIIQCLLRSMQTILEIVTHYSYIFAAVKGESFAESGRQVFSLILKYTTLLASVSVMTNSVIAICKMSVCVASCFCYYAIIISSDQFAPGGENTIYSPIASIVICFLLSYLIASGFFNTFSVAVDTILICYVTDIDENELRHMGDKRFRFPAHVKSSTFSFLPSSSTE
jgi:solute carrier family 44 (choline transporter-like protein), member 2/4/5